MSFNGQILGRGFVGKAIPVANLISVGGTLLVEVGWEGAGWLGSVKHCLTLCCLQGILCF